MTIGNLFADIPGALPDELFEELMADKGIKIERIVSKGHASPDGFWYDQSENEWVLVVQGAARLRIEGIEGAIELTAGTYTNLPAHVKHRVDWTKEDEETIWLAIFY